MQVIVNGCPRDVPDEVSVAGLLLHLGLSLGPVAVEINRVIVCRADHPTHRVARGDAIEIVHLVGGG